MLRNEESHHFWWLRYLSRFFWRLANEARDFEDAPSHRGVGGRAARPLAARASDIRSIATSSRLIFPPGEAVLMRCQDTYAVAYTELVV